MFAPLCCLIHVPISFISLLSLLHFSERYSTIHTYKLCFKVEKIKAQWKYSTRNKSNKCRKLWRKTLFTRWFDVHNFLHSFCVCNSVLLTIVCAQLPMHTQCNLFPAFFVLTAANSLNKSSLMVTQAMQCASTSHRP